MDREKEKEIKREKHIVRYAHSHIRVKSSVYHVLIGFVQAELAGQLKGRASR